MRISNGTRHLLAGVALVIPALCIRPSLGAVSPADMQALIDAHGVKALVEIVLDLRNGQISIENNGQIKEIWGRPRLDLITPRSLSNDAKQAGFDLDRLKERLASNATAQEEAQRRLAGSGVKSAVVPLANMDSDLRVWSPRGSQTVKKLIEDADRYRRGWTAERNELRQKEAYRRNRRVERILMSWQSQHGSADMQKVAQRLRRQAQARRDACRGLKRRKDNEEWKERDCDTWTRSRAMMVDRKLKAQLRKPFDDFNKAMKSAGMSQ